MTVVNKFTIIVSMNEQNFYHQFIIMYIVTDHLSSYNI